MERPEMPSVGLGRAASQQIPSSRYQMGRSTSAFSSVPKRQSVSSWGHYFPFPQIGRRLWNLSWHILDFGDRSEASATRRVAASREPPGELLLHSFH